MYLVRENIFNGETTGYFVDEKISGKLIESHFVDVSLKKCSCKHFKESQNPYQHFHINLCKKWLKMGKPECALFSKSKTGKIIVLCNGFIRKSYK